VLAAFEGRTDTEPAFIRAYTGSLLLWQKLAALERATSGADRALATIRSALVK